MDFLCFNVKMFFSNILCKMNPPVYSPVGCCLVAKLCLNLWDPMDCSPPGSSVHGILQARLLEWEAISFSRGSSQPRDQIQVSCISRQILYHSTTREAPHLWVWKHNLRRMIGKIAQFVTASSFSNSFFHLCTHTQRVDPSHFRYMVCIFVWSLWFKRSMMYSSLWFWTYILWVFCTAVT